MPRSVLDEENVHPSVRDARANFNREVVDEVKRAIAANDVVVVGMRQNPFPKKVRKLFDETGVRYQYLEYGSYLSDWRRRLAIKMWSGWPTFPMVFVKGTLVGGYDDTKKLVSSGELATLLGK